MKKLIVMAAAAVFVAASLGSAAAQTAQPPFVYSVKFLCGLQTLSSNAVTPTGTPVFPPPVEPPVKPGNYATNVNVHNFHGAPTASVTFCKKAVVALPESQKPRGPISPIVTDTLKPDEALEVDCADIVSLFPPGIALPAFIKGFVEINSPLELSVTAVYTTQTCRDPQIQTMPVSTGGERPAKPCRHLGELQLEVVPQNHFVGDVQCQPPS